MKIFRLSLYYLQLHVNLQLSQNKSIKKCSDFKCIGSSIHPQEVVQGAKSFNRSLKMRKLGLREIKQISKIGKNTEKFSTSITAVHLVLLCYDFHVRLNSFRLTKISDWEGELSQGCRTNIDCRGKEKKLGRRGIAHPACFFPRERGSDTLCMHRKARMLRRKLAPRLVTEKRHHIPPLQFPFTCKWGKSRLPWA